MCEFLSVISDGNGRAFHFGWEEREKILKGELKYKADSHTSLAEYFKGELGLPVKRGQRIDDVVNKFEYNPFTKKFKVDQLNAEDDSKAVEEYCRGLDFKKIVPSLIIKPIVHPFKDVKPPKKIGKRDIANLKKWSKVWDSVWNSVGGYASSFFDLPEFAKYKCCAELWERGLVPSFDGEVWRLHGGLNGEALFEISKKELNK